MSSGKQFFEIRAIRVDEFGRLSELIKGLHHYQRFGENDVRLPVKEELEEELTHKEDGTNKLRANKFGTHVIVAVDLTRLEEPNHGYIVGYMIYSQCYSIIKGRYIYMTSFFIEEDYRRRGMGRKFMEYLRLQGLVLGSLQLDVPFMNNNHKGISFYATFGSYLCNQDYEMMGKKVE